MRTVVTGGTGFVGRFIVEDLAADRDVVVAGRTPPAPGYFSRAVPFVCAPLSPATDWRAMLDGAEEVVHAAFAHVPGRYRGGEGDDPQGFQRANLEATVALFGAAKAAGVRRLVFLSSRAAVDGEDRSPDTLYGQVKREAERTLDALTGPGFIGLSLRLTGVYGPAGPGRRHKWADLFDDYLAGRPIAPRNGTELHGRDAASAVRLLLSAAASRHSIWEATDLLLDRHDLLDIVRRITLCPHPLPPSMESVPEHMLEAEPLRRLGWRPGGMPLLRATVPDLLGASEAGV